MITLTNCETYIPHPGDKVSWQHSNKSMGIVKGEVDYIESYEYEIAKVWIPPKDYQNGEESGHRRSRFRKSFDQLTLLERPGVDT